MKHDSRIILITVVSFGIYFVLDVLYFGHVRQWLYGMIGQWGISHLITYAISGIPLYLGILLMHKPSGFAESLGLNKSLSTGILAPLIFTLPMFIGFAFLFAPHPGITLNGILIGVIAAAFFEELFFRGFLFGQLYRYTRLGFIPSSLFGSLLFAAIHLYQSPEWLTLVGIFGITFFGALLFGWLYVEWRYNLWVPIFLHLFMNLAWMVFAVSDNALGGIYANIFRALTITLAIVLTLIYKLNKGLELAVNKRTVWMKRTNQA